MLHGVGHTIDELEQVWESVLHPAKRAGAKVVVEEPLDCTAVGCRYRFACPLHNGPFGDLERRCRSSLTRSRFEPRQPACRIGPALVATEEAFDPHQRRRVQP